MGIGIEEKKPLLIQLNGQYYDIADFASKHPGGAKVLHRLAGEEVGEFIRGEKRIMGVRHEHSEAAYNMLERYNVNAIQKGDPLIESKTGMLFNVGSLGSEYWHWIHQPYDGTLRLFDSDLLESMTRTAWWVVPAVWMPIVILFSIISIASFSAATDVYNSILLWSAWFVIGVLTWTFTEYSLHRWVFHWKPSPHSPNQILLHFLAHGLHHKTPMDGDRLVFPPVPAALIVGIFYVIYSNTFQWSVFCAFGAGKLFGYVTYDMVHYYLHHGSPRPRSNLHYRKVYHHNHHFKNFDVGFGISTSLWDYVFHTIGMGPL
ncbi:Protein CBG12227 [Caenorhabditis briggsae]|uniref:Fatty acid 2-hydroxylase n=2 Tax=Caenorhabditis briggsae TaxID=6238 RepID=A0AAE9E1K5_CAEBR|nr:Protein CBG12227 [Caenorhabditis briggsae]UMM12969.1 hypothetical protein L5515_001478 [Caenorhabditis briggsae]CAP31203.1 Protein CBG12227 [Caenorhabditis briggsae]